MAQTFYDNIDNLTYAEKHRFEYQFESMFKLWVTVPYGRGVQTYPVMGKSVLSFGGAGYA